MILGRDTHVHAACFDELDAAIGRDDVVLNAHAVPGLCDLPNGHIVYNLENIRQLAGRDLGHRRSLWDFSKRNVAFWASCGRAAKYVPVGYHHTMERFKKAPWNECQYDVVFCGAPNERRNYLLDSLIDRGLRVCQVPPTMYGAERDKLLATSRLAINPLYYEDGLHPVLRTAHATANMLPILCENSPEMPDWALLRCDYSELVEKALGFVTRRREWLDHMAEAAYLAFRMHPMELPR